MLRTSLAALLLVAVTALPSHARKHGLYDYDDSNTKSTLKAKHITTGTRLRGTYLRDQDTSLPESNFYGNWKHTPKTKHHQGVTGFPKPDGDHHGPSVFGHHLF
jgi:hypothetical protein